MQFIYTCLAFSLMLNYSNDAKAQCPGQVELLLNIVPDNYGSEITWQLAEAGEILNKTREIVVAEFEKPEEDVKDGMDIAIYSLEGNKLQYAGANNPLWIIRNGVIIETKANKQPTGQFDNPEPYTTHSFDLEQGDAIYIFSDGYVDQFGGEKGKKFKSNAFRELLLSIQNEAMEEQKTSIDESFETWRGNLEQIDDFCIIGVRI
jgi:serine phosphatase RsbU (regulator of sigma subunit)